MAGDDGVASMRARFGLDLPEPEMPAALRALLDRRVSRRYRDQDVPDALLDLLLAAAQSAPSKSDLQQ
jgi:FMN reductase [NAD(P)H]